MGMKVSNKTIDKLKYDLVREGLIEYQNLLAAIEKSETIGESLSQVLIQENMIAEGDLLSFLEEKLHIPAVELEHYTLDKHTLSLIKEADARKFKILPLFKIEDILTVAMSDPLDFFALNNIIVSSHYKVEPVLCSERSILTAIDKFYSGEHEAFNIPPNIEIPRTMYAWTSILKENLQDSSQMMKLLSAMIDQAIKEGASDVHLDPYRDEYLVQFRIDGELCDRGSLPILLSPALISSLKSRASFNIKTKNFPQNGKLDLLIGDKSVNTRVATFPTSYGEKIAIKILWPCSKLEELGMELDDLERFKEVLKRDKGIIIAAGSLGDLLQTTLYAALEIYKDHLKSIISIENPILSSLDSVHQSQINTSIGYDYETALAHSLLQEPDIIYIDHLEEEKQIKTVFNVAASGKLILTSMFAENTLDALLYLFDSGMRKRTVLSGVSFLFSQKPVRILCNSCKEAYTPSEKILEKYELSKTSTYYKAIGCPICYQAGYRGRTFIFEIFEITEKVRQKIQSGVLLESLYETPKNYGIKTIRENALVKINKGITSLEQIVPILEASQDHTVSLNSF